MTTQLITSQLRVHTAEQWKESVAETANTNYYMFAGHPAPYSNSSIPDLVNSVQETRYNVYDNMVYGKRLADSDVSMMCPRHDWVANTVYAAYDSNTDISNSAYYAVVNASSNYYVFKVLDNYGNVASTIQPDIAQTSANDDFYSTSDGYVWKYMYTVPKATWDKFVTTDFIPVVPDANVTGNAVSGAIDVIRLTFAGSNYDATLANTFSTAAIQVGGNPLVYQLALNASSNNNFYAGEYLYLSSGTGVGQIRTISSYDGAAKTVTLDSSFTTVPDTSTGYQITPKATVAGDGTNAIARALINTASSNSVYQVEVINRGRNYSYATITVVGNTGGAPNTATCSAILAPDQGHGSNPSIELGAGVVCFSTTFANSEANTISVANDIRTFGLIKNPLFANVVANVVANTIVGVFTPGELVLQNTSNASGYVVSFGNSALFLTNVSGQLTTGLFVVGQTSAAQGNVSAYTINGLAKGFNTFDQTYRYTVNYISGTFTSDEGVYQGNVATANGLFHSNTASFLCLTRVRGTVNVGSTLVGQTSVAVANVLTIVPPDIVKNTGEVLYLENINPITRSSSQSETIKIVLTF